MTPENIKKLEAVGFVRMNYPHNPLMFSHALLDGEEFDFSAASVDGAIKILAQIYHVKGRDSAKRDIRNALGIILDSAIKNNPVMSKSVEKRVLVQIQDIVKSLNLHCKMEDEHE